MNYMDELKEIEIHIDMYRCCCVAYSERWISEEKMKDTLLEEAKAIRRVADRLIRKYK